LDAQDAGQPERRDIGLFAVVAETDDERSRSLSDREGLFR